MVPYESTRLRINQPIVWQNCSDQYSWKIHRGTNNDAPKCAGDEFDQFRKQNGIFRCQSGVSFIWDRIVRYIFDVFLMIVENKEF